MTTERRETRRYEPQVGRDEARIIHRGESYVALLLDLSAEGFRVCVHSGKQLHIGDIITLETCDGQHVARVAHLTNDTVSARTYFGLQRLNDAPLHASGETVREQIRRRQKFEEDRTIDFGPIIAYVVLPAAIGVSILQFVAGADGLKEISRMITQQIGL